MKLKEREIFERIQQGHTDFEEGSIGFPILFAFCQNFYSKLYIESLKNLPDNVFVKEDLNKFIALDAKNLDYISEKLVKELCSNRNFVKEMLVGSENIYHKLDCQFLKDIDLLLEVAKENLLIVDVIKDKPFMTEDVCLKFIEVDFGCYSYLEDKLSKENKREAFNYLVKPRYRNTYFHISIDGITLIQARKLMKYNHEYYSGLPKEHREDLSVLANAFKSKNLSGNRFFDLNKVSYGEMLRTTLSEVFLKDKISPLQFVKKYNETITTDIWKAMLCNQPFVLRMENQGINPFQEDLDYTKYIRQMLLKEKLEKTQSLPKTTNIRKKI